MSVQMFGTPGGFAAYDEDQAKLAQLGAQTDLLRAQVPHQRALTELNLAQAEQMRSKTAQEQQMLEARRRVLMQPNPAKPDIAAAAGGEIQTIEQVYQGMAALQLQRGNQLLELGDLEGGTKLIRQAGNLHKQTTGAIADRALAARRAIQTDLQKSERLAQIFSKVNSPETYVEAIEQYMNDPVLQKDPLPVDLRAYDPDKIRNAVSATQTFDRMKRRELAELEGNSKRALRSAIAANMRFNQGISDRRVSVAEDAERRREREGGGRLPKEQSTHFRTYVGRLLKGSGYELEPAEDTEMRYEISERAAHILLNNPAVETRAEAAKLAIQQLQSEGILPPPKPKVGGIYKPTDRVNRPETGTATPASTPAPTAPPRKLPPAPNGVQQWTTMPTWAKPATSEKDTVDGVPYYDAETGIIGVRRNGKWELMKKGDKPTGQQISGAATDPMTMAYASLFADNGDDDEEDDNG